MSPSPISIVEVADTPDKSFTNVVQSNSPVPISVPSKDLLKGCCSGHSAIVRTKHSNTKLTAGHTEEAAAGTTELKELQTGNFERFFWVRRFLGWAESDL